MHSSTSFDLNFPGVDFPSVISESLTMDTLPTIESSEDVPPFPSGRRPPIATIISLGTCLTMFPSLHRPRSPSVARDSPNVSVTIPTAPRLKFMLKENLCVKRWVVGLIFRIREHALIL